MYNQRWNSRTRKTTDRKHRKKGTVLTGNNDEKEATEGYIAYHFIPTPYDLKTRAVRFDM
jgi:hypothetical protein